MCAYTVLIKDKINIGLTYAEVILRAFKYFTFTAHGKYCLLFDCNGAVFYCPLPLCFIYLFISSISGLISGILLLASQ